ncbi:prenyltransferase [Chryseobacterium lacus]|uniref:Prenyltransferase n=1 Tax=Chryseobacterium lacus TaxID=2058346 RepID=A0A368N004_9FLAO|nr:UbiA family prenyltransferase [Chryseobacterium lacus]RCU43847.1 prenyltransferase [Chryseobacterium lacus]RST28770.1 prenyltransferase [Chryseobacterium lacus]
MGTENRTSAAPASAPRTFSYRISQLIGFLVGARFFMALLLTFALYVSTFFLFNQEENLRQFVFDFRVHGIIFCAVLSILAGGIINQFYDVEKDHLIKPFRTRLQSFLKQKYFLYAYIILNTVSLGVAFFISYRVFLFYLLYQFLMWFYSHKLSRLLILNNLTFVALTLYPFFGMLVYYRTFSGKVMMMAAFLFLMLLMIDIIKDTLTAKVDRIFGYTTIPIYFGRKTASVIAVFLLISTLLVSAVILYGIGFYRIMGWYFVAGFAVILTAVFQMFRNTRNARFITLNLLRLWIFIGILAMLADGIVQKY